MNKFIKNILANLIAAVMLSMPVSVFATPITYIYEGFNASGSIGGQQFSNVNFTITAAADTDNIGPWCCSDGQNTHLSTTIEIDGFSLADILTPSHSWYGVLGTVGIGQDMTSNWMTFNNTTPAGYDLSTSLSTVFGTALHVNQFNNVSTSLGVLSFTDTTLEGSFTAIAANVPEPATTTLLGLGLLGFMFARGRKSMKS